METGEPYDLELEFITAKGNKIWVHSVGKAHQENGVTKVVSGTFQDITERKKAEKKLKSRNKELEMFNEITVGRELKMIELKKEINELLKKSGEKPKYDIPV